MLLVIGALGYLARVFMERQEEIARISRSVNWVIVAASFVLLVLAWLLLAAGWHLVLRLLGQTRPPLACMRVFVVAQLGKYLPGNVWHYVGRVYLSQRLEVGARDAVVGLYVETLLTVAGPLIVVLLTLAGRSDFPLRGRLPIAGSLLALTLMMLHPGVLRYLLILLRQHELAERTTYRPAEVYRLLPLYVGGWGMIGAAFYLLVAAFGGPGPGWALPVIGAWSAAFILGLVTPIAPGGLGVREGLLYLLLTPLTGAPVAVLASLASRAWFILAEVTSVLVVVPMAWIRELEPRGEGRPDPPAGPTASGRHSG